MTDERGPHLVERFATWLENASRFGLWLAGTAYVSGLLITNIYLGSKKIPLGSLAQARLVLTGGLWLFLLAVSAILARLAVHDLQMARESWRGRRLFSALKGYAGALMTLFLLVSGPLLLGGFKEPYSWLRAIGTAAILVWTVFCLTPTLENASELVEWFKKPVDVHPLRPFANVFFFMTQAILIMMSLAAYALVAQPGLIQPLGGSRPMPVLLVPAAQASVFRILGLSSRADGLIGPVKLIHEDGEAYYIATEVSGSERVLRLPKGSVDAVVQDAPELSR